MRWFGRRESANVEDQRGFGGRGLALGGGGGLVVLVLAFLFGINPADITGPSSNVSPTTQTRRQSSPAEDQLASFTKVVFADTEDVWQEQFRKLGKTYRMPTLVLYSGSVRSACGSATAAVGPFYCGRDAKVYIDLSFYRDMERKLEASGDFARAYVIAHEVGHHVQNLLGFMNRRAGPNANENSVRLELQADFLAGVWAHHGQKKFNFLEDGDLDEAINAAFQVGDDRLQKKGQGYVVPDSFTHGSSKQRAYWFKEGFKTGDVRQANRLFEEPLDLAE